MFYRFTELTTAHQRQFHQTNEYITGFLNGAHPYRSGKVCPFVGSAEQKGLVRYRVCESDRRDHVEAILAEAVEFQVTENRGGALILMFPPGVRVRKLKAVMRGAMIPALQAGLLVALMHLKESSTSLHSRDFYPFRAPQPIFVLRDIVSPDLTHFISHPPRRKIFVEFLRAYVHKFSSGMGEEEKNVEKAREQLRMLGDRSAG